jgi:tRNA(Arg) A34 adenosine deaminase TadA
MMPDGFCISLPEWVAEALPPEHVPLPELDQRMELVLRLAQRNIEEHTGGPFAAAVFDSVHRLISVGLNLVEHSGCSIAHAEMVAISLAQKALGTYRLTKEHELVVTAEPCAMCAGALPWSGIGRLVTAATDQDIRAIGFDEGSKPANWQLPLQARGIHVTSEFMRVDGIRILNNYQAMGGKIYNGAG